MRTFAICCVLTFVGLPLTADSGSAPVLQWVKQISGSSQSFATASAVDSQGNLYITGNTASTNFPIVSAAQPRPGGSTLTRVDAASGAAQKLYDPLLASAANFGFDPQNPSTLYASSSVDTAVTDAGSNSTTNLIRSTDSGVTWSTVGAFPSGSIIFRIAVDPAHGNVLYAGTYTLGMLKSIDGGITWIAINPGAVGQFWLDPHFPSVLFAAAQGGLVRSSDAGATWSVVPTGPGSSSFQGGLAFDPFTPGTIYSGGSSLYSPFINESTDDGLTWTPVSPLPVTPPPAFCADCLIFIDPVHPGVWYFASPDYLGGLYRSDDAGASWNLKVAIPVTSVTFNPAQGVAYATVEDPPSIVVSSDGFNTYQPWQPVREGTSIQVVGKQVFVGAPITTDVFVTKLDPNGNIVYSTYFGGSAADSPTGLAVGTDGSVYVTGGTQSMDFPTTAGAFLTAIPAGGECNRPGGVQCSFVFKLNPDGALGWSTYFTASQPVYQTIPNAIAVDASGSPYIAGTTYSGLPVTPGVLQTQPPGLAPCTGTMFGCDFPNYAGFLARFKADGSGLSFSTYVYQDATRYVNTQLAALALDASGNAYVGGIIAAQSGVALLSADGATLVASNNSQNYPTINAIALDANHNLYAAGFGATVPATPGAFQTVSQWSSVSLPDGNAPNQAFVSKFDSALTQMTAATYLGGESTDGAMSLAIDSAGNVIVAGNSSSKGFPTRAPFQASFSGKSGFVAALDPSLSTLLYSTYLGDQRFFRVAGAFPDNQGNILLAGSIVGSTEVTVYADSEGLGLTYLANGDAILANKIALTPSPAVRLDAAYNAASQLAVPLSPGERIAAAGAGFGPDAQLMLNGVPLSTSQTANGLTALLPAELSPEFGDATAVVVTVTSGGVTSNPVVMPTAAAWPGLYSADGSGHGQGYILNSDGTMNSPSNPAAGGSAITIFATGVGSITESGPYAVAAQPVSVFIDGFYANGIAASLVQPPGLPADTYTLSVYIPSPFKLPPQVQVELVSGSVSAGPQFALMRSQPSLVLSVQQ